MVLFPTLYVREVYFDGDYGNTRVRNGMLGSFPPGLLAPTYLVVIYRALKGNYVLWGLNGKGSMIKT